MIGAQLKKNLQTAIARYQGEINTHHTEVVRLSGAVDAYQSVLEDIAKMEQDDDDRLTEAFAEQCRPALNGDQVPADPIRPRTEDLADFWTQEDTSCPGS